MSALLERAYKENPEDAFKLIQIALYLRERCFPEKEVVFYDNQIIFTDKGTPAMLNGEYGIWITVHKESESEEGETKKKGKPLFLKFRNQEEGKKEYEEFKKTKKQENSTPPATVSPSTSTSTSTGTVPPHAVSNPKLTSVIGKTAHDAVLKQYQDGPENLKQTFYKFGGNINYQISPNKDKAYYEPSTHTVCIGQNKITHLNANLGDEDVVYHENAHATDYEAGKTKGLGGPLSVKYKNGIFDETVKQEINNFIDNEYKKEKEKVLATAEKNWKEWENIYKEETQRDFETFSYSIENEGQYKFAKISNIDKLVNNQFLSEKGLVLFEEGGDEKIRYIATHHSHTVYAATENDDGTVAVDLGYPIGNYDAKTGKITPISYTKKDFQKFDKKYKDRVDNAISDMLKSEGFENVSDIFSGVTKCKIQGRWGHRESYWRKDKDNCVIEAKAQIEALLLTKSDRAKKEIDWLQKNCPETLKIFNEMIDFSLS